VKNIHELEEAINEDRVEHGKKTLKPREDVIEEKEIKVSTTVPDSGYMVRNGKPEGFFYLNHRTVDINSIPLQTYMLPQAMFMIRFHTSSD
jgi:hypothetical protein